MPERKTLFVNVIVPVPIRKEFTYRVPFELNDSMVVGARVVIPFGKGKLMTGIVSIIHEDAPDDYQAKYVEYLLDERPIVTPKQYRFWKWISGYYMAPIGDVLNAALPANFKLASETKILLHPDYSVNYSLLSEREKEIVAALEIRETLNLKEVSEIIGIKTIQPIVKELIDRKVVISLEALSDKFIPKTAVFVTLMQEFLEQEKLNELLENLDSNKRTEKQLNGLLRLIQLGNYVDGRISPVLRKDLLDAQVSISSLNTLEKRGILIQEKLEISRFIDTDDEENQFKALSDPQQRALTEVHEGFEKNKVVLLRGVTGSGKTEIYVHLIQEQLDLGKQVLFLLPEIALTTQLIQRLSHYFGDQIGVYHSKFNQNERVEIWNHILNNNAHRFRIILGARSSIFLPFQDLGLVIVDEEHESSYKQYDPSPRYNARDAAIVLSKIHDARILLGSATPSIESFYNATTEKYHLVELSDRFGGILLPEILCANIQKERKQKSMKSHFSSFLLDHIHEALNAQEQIILFQNRRGYTPLWMCEICNWTPQCKNCDVSLTYHKQTNTLKCHYCGYSTSPIGTCGRCGSNRLKMLGFGTEKIEDELSLMFPNHTIGRLDLDTTRAKNAYSQILADFDTGKIDILIGTQMISKGLDFDRVNLVGILDADMLLNRADFRAFERSFQLMTQVAGRSGRRKKRGKVILQTGDPDHWVIQRVVDHDYLEFYRHEILERKHYFYPPYFKIIQITLKHRNENVLLMSAHELAESLRESFKERVLGPESPIVKRVKNLYLKRITLKIERNATDRMVKDRLQSIIDLFYTTPKNKSVRITIDVDPT